MLESCLSHKIIRDFLRNHSENKWKDLIPVLIEIGILNLQKAFNKIIFTYEELKKISHNLHHEQIERDKERSKEVNKENIYDSLNMVLEKEENKINLNNQNKKFDNNNNNIKEQKIYLIDSNRNNPDKIEKLKTSNDAIKELKNNIKNNYQYFKNNISIDFKNKLTKERKEHFKKLVIEKNNQKDQKKKDKISYAISYDKNLRPSSIAKKINNTTSNNTNLKTDYTTNLNNIHFNNSHNYSSDKKINQSKSRSKNKNKDKYLNLNLNNLNINKYEKNISDQRKSSNIAKQKINNNLIRIGGNEKPNYYKKLNNIIQKCNLLKNEASNKKDNHSNRIDKNINKININKKGNNSNNYGQINNYFKNNNFINTLFQRLNSNEKDLKSLNNYFSNREELENFISKNRVDNYKFSEKSEKKLSNYKNNIIKSDKQEEKKNKFLKFDKIGKDDDMIFKKELKKCKNKSTKSIKKKEKEKENVNPLLKSLQTKNDFLKIEKLEENTPNKIYIKTEKEVITPLNNNLKDIIEKKDINNNDKNEGLQSIKLFDKNEEEIKGKENNENKEINDNKENKENNPFSKKISKNRYFHMFGHEIEGDFSLTQIEKDCSGIYDSSISNENQINPEYFFKESPKNIFKNEKSNEHSVNSNEHMI